MKDVSNQKKSHSERAKPFEWSLKPKISRNCGLEEAKNENSSLQIYFTIINLRIKMSPRSN